jgi:hypothetical protein
LIVDLSKAGKLQSLGIIKTGTAPKRVVFLPNN